ncbi:hypothetical protein F2Q70_00045221 [Brassica cretica]|uniref:Uncharacterized protein n=1 Tax=Brassica cretica TaxID=69181 RepID=A0A8S9KLA8_BRACR|nr:hypothetical protein F2Q70_00045221 [Brassica cretica]
MASTSWSMSSYGNPRLWDLKPEKDCKEIHWSEPWLLLWAPFLNFRKFPRDPFMKYPWDKPKDPSTIKNGYLKYPFAKPEDYDY